jgi:hypothetical protein
MKFLLWSKQRAFKLRSKTLKSVKKCRITAPEVSTGFGYRDFVQASLRITVGGLEKNISEVIDV